MGLLVKLVRGIGRLLFALVRRSVRLAIISALVGAVLFVLDSVLLDEKPERRD